MYVMQNGKYVYSTSKNPRAYASCDRSGFVFNHDRLVNQLEWRGDNLIPTNLYVGDIFVDKPQQQNRPFKAKGDPEVVKNPRFPQHNYVDPTSNPAPYSWQDRQAELETVNFGQLPSYYQFLVNP